MTGKVKDKDDITDALEAIMKRSAVPEEFKEWCKAEKILSPLDLMILAGPDATVEEKVLLPAKSKLVTKDAKIPPAVEIAIRKCVMFCRDVKARAEQPTKKELDESDDQDLDAAWAARGWPPLSTKERVGRILMAKLFALAVSDPPKFEVFPLEQITLYCSTSKLVDQVVKDGSSNALVTQSQESVPVKSAHGVIDRIRAFLLSFSYVSTSKPDWCPLDVARVAAETIWTAMEESESHNAPISFYSDAWMCTLQVIQQKIVVFKGTLAEALQMTSSWSQFWIYNCPGVNCPRCSNLKGSGKTQYAQQAMSATTRADRRNVQNLIWQTMQRFNKPQKPGFPGKGGFKGFGKQNSKGWVQTVQKPQFQKAWSGGKGKEGGKGKQGKQNQGGKWNDNGWGRSGKKGW